MRAADLKNPSAITMYVYEWSEHVHCKTPTRSSWHI